MDRTNPINSVGGQAQDSAGDADMVAGPPLLDDDLGLQRASIIISTGQPADPGLESPEPPIILAMTRGEAALLINLLSVDGSDAARSLGYRLCNKYVQTMGFRFEVINPRTGFTG